MKKDIRAGSLLFPNPVLVVCTYDVDGKANAATRKYFLSGASVGNAFGIGRNFL
jgi:flavin reductase (DIM6/NTAB) family NADH-FMN oxidoreductase RutF